MSKNTNVWITSDVDSALVCIDNKEERKGKNTECLYTPAKLTLPRSEKNIYLTVQKDSITKNVCLRSRLNAAYIAGNCCTTPYIFGLGYLIDYYASKKRYSYPKSTYVSFLDTNKVYNDFFESRPNWSPAQEKQLNFKLAIPEGNHFYINKNGNYGSSTGFLGISVGLEYYFDKQNSINSDIGTMMDFFLPFPVHVDYEGEYSKTSAIYWDLQLGKERNKNHFGYGIQGNKTIYTVRETASIYPEYVDTIKHSTEQFNVGLALSYYYSFTDHINLGFNYYPSVFAWNERRFDLHYSHLMMLELLFKFRFL